MGIRDTMQGGGYQSPHGLNPSPGGGGGGGGGLGMPGGNQLAPLT
jgi:hypothetical protein